MGAGIAQLAAARGCGVHLTDVSDEVLTRAFAGIERRLDRLVEQGKLTAKEREAALRRISTANVIEGLEEVELAVEAVVEDLAVKREVFARLERATSDSAVLATNTSSLSVTEIARGLQNPERVIGMHFFNPVPVMPLVEVVAAEASDESAVDVAFRAASAWGKMPVRVKDAPGFIVNRVARGFYLEALRLLGEGVAGVDEIDRVMCRHGGFRMGPFELMDLIGLDVNLAAGTSIWERMGRPSRLAPHRIHRELVETGHLGRKAGRGFYGYDHDHKLPAFIVDRQSFELSPLLKDAMLALTFRAGAREATSTEQYILCRILGAVINEAGLAYSEGIASSADIDIAMLAGMNYPRGPLAWADEIGHRTVRGVLKALNELVTDDRYSPAPLFAGAV